MRLLYSVRDALGRELWWTASRKAALALAHNFNVAGVGAKLPVRVWKCNIQQDKQST